ncbi:MAG: replication-associated recombination protein A [Campylobacterota bacterium]|nr:replication-associated recombination protein A [Campylobacterota bacterium]
MMIILMQMTTNDNLANLLRPKTLEEFIGQSHIISKNKALYKLITSKDIPHMFFYGKPGTGKTTLSKIIAKSSGYDFYNMNATSLKIDELRTIFKRYQDGLLKPLIFIDEVHRLTKTQQEVLLPIMENYDAIIIGASTENPYFSLTNGIRSRSFIYEFKVLNYKELEILTNKAINFLDIKISEEAKDYLIVSSGGDGRALLNLLEYSSKVNTKIDLELLKELRPNSISDGVSSSQSHYDITSALIKSLRGSDIDAALYYLGRLIDGAESVEYITRRLVIFASEDIGNANPNALNLATSTMISTSKIGYPESKIILSQCVIYLASCPKSNSSYNAINNTLKYINSNQQLSIPKHLQDSHIGYKYPHDYGGYVDQQYLEKNLNFYESKDIGYEKTLNEWISKIKNMV